MPYYRYPYEALTNQTDYLQITIKSHSGTPSLVENPVSFGTAADAAATPTGDPNPVGVAAINDIIILPMPSNISDSNSVGYGEDSLDVLGAAAGGVALSVMKAGGDAFKEGKSGTKIAEAFHRAIRDANKFGGAALDAYTRGLAASAAGVVGANVTANQLLTRETGQILNPNMELLFSGPTLRTFQFQFKFTPRDRNESRQVKSIIRSFKTHMAPSIEGAGNAFLKSPNIFELRYRKGITDHPFLNRFKQCALTNMSVNYTGEGVYATYSDATPVSMVMTLDFKELVPIYADDYADVTSANQLLTTKGVGY